MARVVLHGELAEKFRPEYNLNIRSPGEAVRALGCVVPGFHDAIKEGAYYVFVESNDNHFNIDEDSFVMNIPGDVHIMPEIVGAKRGGLGKVLLGIAMLSLAAFTGGASVAAWAVGASTSTVNMLAVTTLATAVVSHIGIALVLGGAAQMLSPKKKAASSEANKDQSYIIQGSDVNIEQGAPVPIVYGEVLAATAFISQEITDALPTNTSVDNTTSTFPITYDPNTGWYYMEGMQFSVNL